VGVSASHVLVEVGEEERSYGVLFEIEEGLFTSEADCGARMTDRRVLKGDAEGVRQAAKSVEPVLWSDRGSEEDASKALADTVQSQELPRVVGEW
jgi:hypothetical protein